MKANNQKLAARVMAIFLSVLMAGSGLTMIVALLIDFFAK